MLRLSSVEPAVRPSRSLVPQLPVFPLSMGFIPGGGVVLSLARAA